MPTVISHAVAAAALGQAVPVSYRRDWRFWYMACLCAMLPDADVVGFRFGVAYGDLWGHRGMTHSLAFAAVLGVLAAWRFRPDWKREGWRLAMLFFLITASHGLLDGFTNGGLGVAFFSPFDRTRYFFPWTPLEVSPIGAAGFLSERGLRVMLSEWRWVWLPSLVLGAALAAWRRPGRSPVRSLE